MRPLRLAGLWALDYAFALRALTSAAVHDDPASFTVPPEGRAAAPVLLLPGVWETWRFLRPTVRRLHDAGHPVHVLDDLGRNSGTVAEAAQVVERHLLAHDLRGVVIVAHSKGGLIGAYAMAFADPDSRIDRMVAISTPFSGSRYARFLPLPSLHAFSPRDRTIRLLATQRWLAPRITSIWAAFDPHIPGGSALPGAVNVRLPVVGHFRILGTPELARALDAALQPPPVQAGDGADRAAG